MSCTGRLGSQKWTHENVCKNRFAARKKGRKWDGREGEEGGRGEGRRRGKRAEIPDQLCPNLRTLYRALHYTVPRYLSDRLTRVNADMLLGDDFGCQFPTSSLSICRVSWQFVNYHLSLLAQSYGTVFQMTLPLLHHWHVMQFNCLHVDGRMCVCIICVGTYIFVYLYVWMCMCMYVYFLSLPRFGEIKWILTVFRRKLKTHLFRQLYPDIIV